MKALRQFTEAELREFKAAGKRLSFNLTKASEDLINDELAEGRDFTVISQAMVVALGMQVGIMLGQVVDHTLSDEALDEVIEYVIQRAAEDIRTIARDIVANRIASGDPYPDLKPRISH